MTMTKEMPAKRVKNFEATKPPRDIELVRATMGTVAEALRACYPSINNKEYSERTFIDLTLRDFNEVQKERISKIPTQASSAEKSLLKSGLLKTPLYQKRIEETKPLYWAPSVSDKMYADAALFRDFNSDSHNQRLKDAVNFGKAFISEFMQSFPISRELHGKERTGWKELAIDHLHKFIREAKNASGINLDPRKMEKLKELETNTELSVLESPNARYIVYGAEVRVLLPGQKLMYPSYSVGSLLNEGIVGILNEETQLKFLELMEKRFAPIVGYLNAQKPTSADKGHVQQMLKAYGLSNLTQNKNNLFQFYASSVIPTYAYSSWIKDL